MPQRLQPGRPRPRAGFTLIEVIAVIAIIGMVFAIGIPNLGGNKWSILNNEAELIAQSLRFARQRAVMTGIPHRVLIDLEDGGYLIEWYVTAEDAFDATNGENAQDSTSGDLSALVDSQSGGPGLDFVPPRRSERDYYPIPHRQMGSFRWLDDALFFVGVDGASGWVEGGDYPIDFYVDGTTAAAALEISDAEDRHLTLEIEPLQERVRVREGRARS